MTITLNLTPELERCLTEQAGRLGVAPDQYALQVLSQHLTPADRRPEFVALVQSWMDEEDAEEQKETFEYLVRALDDDRLSHRKLFPPELKGISW